MKKAIFTMPQKELLLVSISGNNAQQISIPVNHLATGVYLIEITTGNNLKQVIKLLSN